MAADETLAHLIADLLKRIDSRVAEYRRLSSTPQYKDASREEDRRAGFSLTIDELTDLRERLAALAGRREQLQPPPRFDPSNHHNALACPYCNPDNLSLWESAPRSETQPDLFWPHEDDSVEAHIYEIRNGKTADYVMAHARDLAELLRSEAHPETPRTGE